MAFKFDRHKYEQILRTQGLNTALTVLHHDMERMEQECFEGSQGWQPELYEQIKQFRRFSTELWQNRYATEPLANYRAK